MSTKWKYATMPAEQRLEELRGGNTELYNEELARTQDVIDSRLAVGLDVSEQKNWAEKVTQNYNLSKSQNKNRASYGYSKRTGTNSHTSALDTATAAHVAAVNSRLSAICDSFNKYVTSLRADYETRRKKAIEEYEAYEKKYEEMLLNGNVSENGGRSMSLRLKEQEMFYDYLSELEAQMNAAIANAKSALDSQISETQLWAADQLSDTLYNYDQLAFEYDKLDYQKQADDKAYSKWQQEFAAETALSEDKLALEREKEQNSVNKSEKELENDRQNALTNYYMWLYEQQYDEKYDNSRLELDREKFEYQKQKDKSARDPEKEQDDKTHSEGSKTKKEFGTDYVNYHNMVKGVMESGTKQPKSSLSAWIDSFELSENEKKKLKKDFLGIN